MRVLYITDGGPGGVSSHVRCLTQCLKGVAEVMVCITYRSDALKKMLDEDGTPYYWCRCKNGHDWRLLLKVRRLIKEFKPEVIHFHDIPFLVALYVKCLRGTGRFNWLRVFSTIHTPSLVHPWLSRRIVNWAVEPCYWLPVSSDNWKNFKSCYPKARGEVFFNPIKIDAVGNRSRTAEGRRPFVVGMVGRNAEVKDWPSFCSVADLVKKRGVGGRRNGEMEFWGVGVSENESRMFGNGAKLVEWKGLQPNGREWIGQMDLLVLTSKTEEMPTVVLEAFQVGTPVCGFVPEGGMNDILALSIGALHKSFILERDCEKIAEIVMDLMAHREKRQSLVEDGRQILVNYFDADQNCRGRLIEIYHGCITEKVAGPLNFLERISGGGG